MAPRDSAYGRLIRHFHEHPRGRLHEFLFWAGLALVLGAATFIFWRSGDLSTPFALIGVVVAICFFGWALLPRHQPRKPIETLPGSSKRREIAQKVKESKSEKRKRLPPSR